MAPQTSQMGVSLAASSGRNGWGRNDWLEARTSATVRSAPSDSSIAIWPSARWRLM